MDATTFNPETAMLCETIKNARLGAYEKNIMPSIWEIRMRLINGEIDQYLANEQIKLALEYLVKRIDVFENLKTDLGEIIDLNTIFRTYLDRATIEIDQMQADIKEYKVEQSKLEKQGAGFLHVKKGLKELAVLLKLLKEKNWLDGITDEQASSIFFVNGESVKPESLKQTRSYYKDYIEEMQSIFPSPDLVESKKELTKIVSLWAEKKQGKV